MNDSLLIIIVKYSPQEIPNSNIIDLIHEVVRPRTKTRNVPGFDQFAHLLQQINIPHEYLGHSFFSASPSTPRTPKRKRKRHFHRWDDDEF